MKSRITLAFLTSFLSCYLALVAIGCVTPTPKPDSFYQAVVTCTAENSTNAAAGAAVMGCLTGAVGGDYTACLAGLVTVGHWSIDEIACVIRAYATTSAQRLNAGTATTDDAVILRNANAWLKAEQVSFR